MQRDDITRIAKVNKPGNNELILDLSDGGITNDSITVVTRALESPHSCVKSLRLQGNHLSFPGITTLVNSLISGLYNLTSLNLAAMGLDDPCIILLSQAIGSIHCPLTTLDISSNRATYISILSLAGAITLPSSHLLSFNIAYNNLHNDSLLELIPTLTALRTVERSLTTLCAHGISIQDTGMAALAAALTSPDCHLSTLQIGHHQHSPSELLPLFQTLALPSHPLITLDLTNASLSVEAIRLLNDAIRSNHCTLTALNLSRNRLPKEGAQSLCAALASHYNRLVSLNLNENVVGPEGAKAVSKLLKSDKCKLNMLCLANTATHNSGAREISQAVKSYHMLTLLDLSDNKIDSQGVSAFLKTIAPSNTLTDLKFTTEHLSADVITQLEAFHTLNRELNNTFLSMAVATAHANEHLPHILPLMETTPWIHQCYTLTHLTNIVSQQSDPVQRAAYIQVISFLVAHGVTPPADTVLVAKFYRQPDLITPLEQHTSPSLIQSPDAEARLQSKLATVDQQGAPVEHLVIKGTDILIGDPGAVVLSQHLLTPQCPLTSVDLEHNNISDIGGQELLQAIKANPRITSFNGMHTLMSAAMLQAIQECIASHTTTSASLLTMVRKAIQHVNDLTPLVTTLRTQKPSTAERCQALAAVITDVGKQPTCTFEQAHAISMVAWLLKQGFTVDEQVHQAATTLNHAAVLSLIAHPPAVTTPASSATTLDLSYQSLNDTTIIEKIIPQLLAEPYPQGLNLSGNPLTDLGIKTLVSALTSVPEHPLNQLTLSAMQLTTLSVNELMPYLCRHTCALTEIDLSHNQLGDGAIMQLAYASESHWRGETINLDFNFIGDCGADVLAKTLARTSSQLTSISLRYNRISDAGAKCLLEALNHRLQQVKNSSLPTPLVTTLDLTGNPISAELQELLTECIECNCLSAATPLNAKSTQWDVSP